MVAYLSDVSAALREVEQRETDRQATNQQNSARPHTLLFDPHPEIGTGAISKPSNEDYKLVAEMLLEDHPDLYATCRVCCLLLCS